MSQWAIRVHAGRSLLWAALGTSTLVGLPACFGSSSNAGANSDATANLDAFAGGDAALVPDARTNSDAPSNVDAFARGDATPAPDAGTAIDATSNLDAFARGDTTLTPEAGTSSDAASNLDVFAGGDATLVPDAGGAPSIDGSSATLIASESGLFYGGCSPVVAGGKVFFCSSTVPLDEGTAQNPLPTASLKSVAVTGGTPTPIGTIQSPMPLPFVSAAISGGLFADSVNVYFIDTPPSNNGNTLFAAPIAGGTATTVASYGLDAGLAESVGQAGFGQGWTFDGTRFYGVLGYETANCTRTTCTMGLKISGLPTDGGAPDYPLPLFSYNYPANSLQPFAFLFAFPLGADPGPSGNVYSGIAENEADGGGLFVATKIPKSGTTFEPDAGPLGGLPELAPGLAPGMILYAFASDGTYAYALGLLTPGYTAGSVLRIPTDGSAATKLATTGFSLYSLTLDSGNAYWITAIEVSGATTQTIGQAVMRVATDGSGSPVTIYDGTSSPWGTPTAVAFDATYAYVTTASGNLVRVNK
jgi:hypothetical protein